MLPRGWPIQIFENALIEGKNKDPHPCRIVLKSSRLMNG